MATVGAKLPGKTILEASWRGVESSGVVQRKELGLATLGASRIPPTRHRPDLRAYRARREVLELNVTPNAAMRCRCSASRARLGAPERPVVRGVRFHESAATTKVAYPSADSYERCPKLVSRVVRGTTTGQLSTWPRERLRRGGLRASSPVVESPTTCARLGQQHATTRSCRADSKRLRAEGERSP